MTELVEVRSTINMPGLPVDRVARVDPTNPHIAMCLDAGYVVVTGRKFSVPTQSARGAVRPSTSAGHQEPSSGAGPAKKRRNRQSRASTPPS